MKVMTPMDSTLLTVWAAIWCRQRPGRSLRRLDGQWSVSDDAVRVLGGHGNHVTCVAARVRARVCRCDGHCGMARHHATSTCLPLGTRSGQRSNGSDAFQPGTPSSRRGAFRIANSWLWQNCVLLLPSSCVQFLRCASRHRPAREETTPTPTHLLFQLCVFSLFLSVVCISSCARGLVRRSAERRGIEASQSVCRARRKRKAG